MTDNENYRKAENYRSFINVKVEAEAVKILKRAMYYEADEDVFKELHRGILQEILDLINRQQAEIERLDKRISGQKHALFEQQSYTAELQNELKTAKSEAIKEFAEKVETALDERVSEKIRERNPHWYIAKRIVRETTIEMTEVSK